MSRHESSPDPPPATVRFWRRMLADEREAARIYRELASRRDGDERDILLKLADAEERHASYWAALLGDRAGRPRPNLRMRLIAALARRFGWLFVLALIQQAEMRSYRTPEGAVPASTSAGGETCPSAEKSRQPVCVWNSRWRLRSVSILSMNGRMRGTSSA